MERPEKSPPQRPSRWGPAWDPHAGARPPARDQALEGSELSRLLSVARGDEPADLLLRNARLVNVFSAEVQATDVAIAGPFVAGLGPGYEARAVVDLEGLFACPGFLDAHVHLESALVPPAEFARAVLPHGVTTVVADPHEIANVLGLAGIRFLLDEAARSPLDVYLNAPSSVPASALATAGAALPAEDLAHLLREPAVLGLAEVMNAPAVVAGDARVLAKLGAFAGRPVDGHCPLLSGPPLSAYVAAGIGSDHESTSLEEALEKLRLGLAIFLREGSAARNLTPLLGLITPETERRCCLCTDDRSPCDLLEQGSIDQLVRMAISSGVDPVAAIRMATLNPAEHFGLRDRGAVAPGRRADLVVFSNLHALHVERVYKDGRLVARDGAALFSRSRRPIPSAVQHTVRIDWSRVDLSLPAKGGRLRAVHVLPDRLLTASIETEARIERGRAIADPDRDLLKIAVIERHHGSGNVGLGFVTGIGLRRGALASTVAHDHHNLVVIGADDRSMTVAARVVAAAGGGQAAVDGEDVLALLPLPIAGLMSDQPIERVAAGTRRLVESARALGSDLPSPFMTLSFLGLEVIPSLRVTDLGVVDVALQKVVPLFLADPEA